MKKILCFAISALFVFAFVGHVWAEMGADAFSGKYNRDQPVFVAMYNNSGVQLSANTIAILDTGGVLTPNFVGTYATKATTSDSVYTIGVWDQDVLSASVGRLCVRGPHRVLVSSQATVAAGTLLGTASGTTTNLSGTVGWARAYSTADGTAGAVLGVAIGEDQATPQSIWWVWVNPNAHQ